MNKLPKTAARVVPPTTVKPVAPSTPVEAREGTAEPLDELVDASPTAAAARAPKADDLALAFPPFKAKVGGVTSKVVPIDITKAVIDLSVDQAAKGLIVSGQVAFRQAEEGMPLLNMLPEPSTATVDGHLLGASQFVRMNIAAGTLTEPLFIDQATFEPLPLAEKTHFQPARLLAEKLKPGAHQLSVRYTLTPQSLVKDDRNESLTVDQHGVDFFMRMSDLLKTLPGNESRGVSFAGAYLPSNFQFDRIHLTVKLAVPASPAQRVFTNGTLEKTSTGFQVTFPPGFTTSEPFLHLVPAAAITEKTSTLRSIDGRDIAITAYAKKSALSSPQEGKQLLDDGQKIIAKTLAEMEQLFGPYPHATFVAQLWPHTMPQDGGSGMEYAGATESALDALRHETIHSYFGRSLTPRDGNAGWIDEAVTTWLTDGRATSDTHAAWSHDLGVDTDYAQETNPAAYNAGPNLLKDLDLDLRGTRAAGSGILTALQSVYRQYKGKPISNDGFVEAVLATAKTPEQLAAAKATFARYGLPHRAAKVS